MKKETFLFFQEATLGGSATAACYPASSFISAAPSADNKIKLHFESIQSTKEDDVVELTYTTNFAHEQAMKAVAAVLSSTSNVRKNIITVFDGVNNVSCAVDNYNGVAQAFTAVDITLA